MQGGEIFIPVLKAASIYNLAQVVAGRLPIEITNQRGGEKLHESLITKEESTRLAAFNSFNVINPEMVTWPYKPWVGTHVANVGNSEEADQYTDAEIRQLLGRDSMNLWERQVSLTPLGGQTLSKLPARYVEGVYPKLLSHGKGGHVWDVDGKEYIDLISGLGAVSVGYNNDHVNRAVINQLEKALAFSLPTVIEADVAEKLCELFPGTEMWKYGKNGVDATLMAIRCARAYTGRSKILVHGYHGCSDHFEAYGTRKAGMIDLKGYTFPYTSFNDSDKFAALIIEPYVFERADWKDWQDWCKRTGTLLIVDEIVSGGRFPEFSAYQHLGLEPDLVTVGKGLANGFPLSAVGGKREIMKTFERDDFFASTTFGGEAVSLAAAIITMRILEQVGNERDVKGQQIKDTFNKAFPKAICKGYPTRLTFDFKRTEDKALFMQEMCKRGVLVGYSNMIMVDHTDEDVNKICQAIIEIADNWINLELDGALPVRSLEA
jgi:glutamate-1-semialdehyde 2,1-aminomutase